MLRYLIDTNICIYVIKNRSGALRGRFRDNAGRLAISSITLGELRFGAEKSEQVAANHDAIDDFVARLALLPFAEGAAAHYGAIRAALERQGAPSGHNDMLIGGHARSEGLIVVTNNRREFDRMPGVMVENWA